MSILLWMFKFLWLYRYLRVVFGIFLILNCSVVLLFISIEIYWLICFVIELIGGGVILISGFLVLM